MKLFRAVYGEKEGAHALLARSESLTQSAPPYTELEGLTDRAGAPPPGVPWEPYLSGYPYKGYYVLTRTFQDNTAPRSGMVRTYAVIAPVEDIATANLNDLIALLPSTPSDVSAFVAGPQILVPYSTNGAVTVLPAGYLDLVVSLVSAARGQLALPVVWSGQVGFDAVVSTLWSCIWPDARKGMHFRLNFGPLDVETQPSLTLVCTPERLTNRWASPYRTILPLSSDDRVNRVRQSSSITRSEALLLQLPEGEPLRSLISDLEVPLAGVRDLPRLERCYDAITAANASNSLERADALRRAARLVVSMAPSQDTAKELKRSLMQSLRQLTVTGSVEGLLALRNFPFESFDNETTPFVDWAATWVQKEINSGVEPVGDLVKFAWETDSAWATAVRSAFLGVTAACSLATVPSALWRWWIEEPETAPLLFEGVLNTSDMEVALATACPTHVTEALANTVAPLTVV